MKKIVSLLSVVSLIVCLLVSSAASIPTTFTPATGKGNGNGNNKKQTTTTDTTTTDTTTTAYGRLIIADADINVALYANSAQSVCDAEDSACFFKMYGSTGMIIADHNYQAFKTLTNVTVGSTAVINEGNGGVITLKCVAVYDGTNTGSGLLDNNGNQAIGTHDYVTYTCLNDTTHVRICQWDIESATNIDSAYENTFYVESSIINKLTSFKTTTSTPTPTPAPTKPGKGNNKKK